MPEACLRPPREWLNEHDAWLVGSDPQVQRDFAKVPRQHAVRQVDGNMCGRQPAAPVYHQELETKIFHRAR